MSKAEPLFEAIKKGDRQSVIDVLTAEPELANARTPEGLSATLLATYYGQPEIAKLIVERGATLNLYEAASVGQLATVQSILAAQPDLINSYAPDGFFSLALAAFFGHTEIVAFLLEQGADVQQAATNAQRVNALHAASANRHFAIARILIERGINVNAQQEGGFTPLQEASQNGQFELVELLLQHGADTGVKNDAGDTALDIARAGGHTEVVKLLAVSD